MAAVVGSSCFAAVAGFVGCFMNAPPLPQRVRRRRGDRDASRSAVEPGTVHATAETVQDGVPTRRWCLFHGRPWELTVYDSDQSLATPEWYPSSLNLLVQLGVYFEKHQMCRSQHGYGAVAVHGIHSCDTQLGRRGALCLTCQALWVWGTALVATAHLHTCEGELNEAALSTH